MPTKHQHLTFLCLGCEFKFGGWEQAYFLSKIHPLPLPCKTGNWEFLPFWYEFSGFLSAILYFLSWIFHFFQECPLACMQIITFLSPKRHIRASILAQSFWFWEILLWVFRIWYEFSRLLWVFGIFDDMSFSDFAQKISLWC